MNQKGMSLTEMLIAVGLLGGVGLFITSYMDKIQNDTNRMHLRYETMGLKSKYADGFAKVDICKTNLEPIILDNGLNIEPLKIFSSPVEVKNLILQMNIKPGPPAIKEVVQKVKSGDTFGDITIVKMDLISSVKTPTVALRRLTNNVSSEVAQDAYQGVFRVTIKKGKSSFSSLLFPVNLTFNEANQLTDCRLNNSMASNTAETCTSILHEEGDSKFRFNSGDCKMDIKNQNYQLHSAIGDESIICQMEKKIQNIKILDLTFAPKNCL